MTTLKLVGLCEHYFDALEIKKRGGTLSPEMEKCLSCCNAHYDPEINHCNPKSISLDRLKELQERFPGAYLL